MNIVSIIQESPFCNLVNEGFKQVLYKNGVLNIQEKFLYNGSSELKTYKMEHLVSLLKDKNYFFEYKFGLIEELPDSSALKFEGELLEVITSNFSSILSNKQAILANVMEESVLSNAPTRSTAKLNKDIVDFTHQLKNNFRGYTDRKHNNAIVFEDNTAIVMVMPEIDAIYVETK